MHSLRLTALPGTRFRWCSFLWAAFALAAVCCTGCGNGQLPTYPVSGKVKFDDGTYPMFGDVEFYNAEHKINARGKIKRDGTFSVGTYEDNDGAIEGDHQIVIIQQTGSPLTAKLDQKIQHDHGKLIDIKFFDYRTSKLSCTISKGDNQVELTVSKNPNQTKDGLPTDLP